jgi:hypothetical protein
MRRVMVRYTVKADRAEENQRYVEAVYAELHRDRPDGIRYATFKLPDGVTFVHIASVETADGKNPLQAVEAFKAFAASVQDRCVEPPITAEMQEVGVYRMLGA